MEGKKKNKCEPKYEENLKSQYFRELQVTPQNIRKGLARNKEEKRKKKKRCRRRSGGKRRYLPGSQTAEVRDFQGKDKKAVKIKQTQTRKVKEKRENCRYT